ncbi:hypothetical protein [Natrinema salaciae]|nr:hypothetical protein [Natrinema salaciae]
MTDTDTEDDEEQTQYGGTEEKEPTTDIDENGDTDDEAASDTDE